jgi:hypothetical protein
MKPLLSILFLLAYLVLTTNAQIRLQEDFETSDSTRLPTGWSKWNQALFPINPRSQWLVSDTGRSIPGIDSTVRLSRARSGRKAARVSWVVGVNDSNNQNGVADAWLVTRRIRNIGANDSLVFWATGGNGGTTGQYFPDTLKILIDVQDSLPANIGFEIALLTWRNTDLYGVFRRYAYHVGAAAGQDLFVAFRYNMDVAVDGFVVHLDDVLVKGPATDVRQTPGVPDEPSLAQNYRNPFNPSTRIEWGVPTLSHVTLKLYDVLGREIGTLVNAEMEPGYYSTAWDATGYPAAGRTSIPCRSEASASQRDLFCSSKDTIAVGPIAKPAAGGFLLFSYFIPILHQYPRHENDAILSYTTQEETLL